MLQPQEIDEVHAHPTNINAKIVQLLNLFILSNDDGACVHCALNLALRGRSNSRQKMVLPMM